MSDVVDELSNLFDDAGEDKITDDDLVFAALEFLDKLTALCNEYGIEVSGCEECGGVVIQYVDRHIERYTLEYNHIEAEYAEFAKVA